MREIKFRGKRIDNNEWVYGMLHYEYIEQEYFSSFDGSHNKLLGNFKTPVIEIDLEGEFDNYVILYKTIGQYTGLKDKNGVEIYECDIVKVDGFTPNEYIIDFIEGGFCLVTNPQKGLPIDINICYPSIGCIIEVVGNIHEVTP